MARMLAGLAILVAMVVLSPIISILSINWVLGTDIPITVQTWFLFWGAMLLAAIPIILMQFFIIRTVR